jgi:hypothetical protein
MDDANRSEFRNFEKQTSGKDFSKKLIAKT